MLYFGPRHAINGIVRELREKKRRRNFQLGTTMPYCKIVSFKVKSFEAEDEFLY